MNVRVNPHVIRRWYREAESISFLPDSPCAGSAMLFCTEEKLIAERLGIDTYTLLGRVDHGKSGAAQVVGRNADILQDAEMRFKHSNHAAFL